MTQNVHRYKYLYEEVRAKKVFDLICLFFKISILFRFNDGPMPYEYIYMQKTICFSNSNLYKIYTKSVNWNFESCAIIKLKLKRINFPYPEQYFVLAHCVYSLLHEIGHFYHSLTFKNRDETIEFMKSYDSLRKMNRKASEDHLITDRQASLIYETLPGEKEANDFAIANFLPSFEYVLKALKKDNPK